MEAVVSAHRWQGENRRPTSMDVARAAGVSQTTVSVVLRGASAGRVAPETQQRVWAAAEALDYRPNEAGRALRGAKSRLIGLVVQDVTDPYFAGVLRGGTREAWDANHIVGLLEGGGPAVIERVVDAVRASWISGVIVCAPTPAEVDALAPILPRAVVLEAETSGAKAQIHYDLRTGMSEAIDHLQHLGHSRIGHIAAGIDAATFAERRAAMDARLPDCPRLVVPHPFDSPSTVTMLADFLAAHGDLTAVLCDTDVLAARVINATQHVARSVPANLSVVGINDSALAWSTQPTLTSVALPAQEAGRLAVAQLTGDLDGERYLLAPSLVIRDSTGPAPLGEPAEESRAR